MRWLLVLLLWLSRMRLDLLQRGADALQLLVLMQLERLVRLLRVLLLQLLLRLLMVVSLRLQCDGCGTGETVVG